MKTSWYPLSLSVFVLEFCVTYSEFGIWQKNQKC